LLTLLIDGHYLNLPVVEADGRLVAIVDVLKLTYATLEQVSSFRLCRRLPDLVRQMNSLSTENQEQEGGPMWGRFFDSFGHDDNDSVVSGSHDPRAALQSPTSHLHGGKDVDVHPNDSASVNDDTSELLGQDGQPIPSGGISSLSKGNAPPVDDGTYVFKFSSPSGRVHRFQSRVDDYEHLREIVAGKLAIDSYFTNANLPEGSEPLDPYDFSMLYTDRDGDLVALDADGGVRDAVSVARTGKSDRVVLVLHGGKGWGLGEKAAAEKAASIAAQEKERAEATKEKAAHLAHSDDIFGIPRDLILPVSLGVLAVVIIGVFTISRLSD
jgi:hypothetical protein